jgi:signal transduction histidine kinase
VNPFGFSGVLAAIFSLAFGMLVVLRSRNKELARIWFLFTLTACFWGVGVFTISLTSTAESALLAWRLTFATSVVWLPSLFFHFVSVFCRIRKPVPVFIHYLTSAVFFLSTPTPLFFEDARPIFGSLHFGKPGPLFSIFTCWWLAFVIYSHFCLWKNYKVASPGRKNQIRHFFWGTAIGYTGGSLVYLPHFGILLYPWGNFTVCLYPVIMSYAIMRFNLMDIRFFVRRAALIIAVYLLLLAAAVPLFLAFYPEPSFLVREAVGLIVMSAVLSAGPIVYAYVVRQNAYFHRHSLEGLTHELKSPLAAIEAALEILQAPQPKTSTGLNQTYMDMIKRNSRRLRSVIDELLTVVLDKANLTGDTACFDVLALCRGVVANYDEQSRNKGLTIEIDTPAKAVIVNGMKDKIGQALSNVVSNALKFTEKGSIRIHVQERNEDVEISVSDEGCGVDPIEVDRIFERFYQTQSGRQAKGAGIGLAIAKLWIEMHGGQIWAESGGDGKGTTVKLVIPRGHEASLILNNADG